MRFSRDTRIPPPWLSMTQKCCKIDKSTISYIIWCVSPQRTVRNLLTSRTAHPMRPIYITWFIYLVFFLRVWSLTGWPTRLAAKFDLQSASAGTDQFISPFLTCRSPDSRGLFKSSICMLISAHLDYLRPSSNHHYTQEITILNFEWDLPL